jgi:hypothetical protein
MLLICRLQGYTFYLVIFYVLVAVLFISVAICIWVGWCFMNDNFPFLWPIKVARVVVSVFVSMFYIASLNIFLMACACKNDHGHWEHLVFKIGVCHQRACQQLPSAQSGATRCEDAEHLPLPLPTPRLPKPTPPGACCAEHCQRRCLLCGGTAAGNVLLQLCCGATAAAATAACC